MSEQENNGVIPEWVRIALRSAGMLALFALFGTALVAVTHDLTREQIAENKRLALLKSLTQLVPESEYDNNLLEDTRPLPASDLLGSSEMTNAYLAKRDGAVHTILITPATQEGYNGTINLLVAIRADGSLAGVRVLGHSETPGLGDLIDVKKSDWIHSFAGHSLDNLTKKQWGVKKDGGIFDQFTGATITPRAIVKAVHKSLRYFAEHREQLLLCASMPRSTIRKSGETAITISNQLCTDRG